MHTNILPHARKAYNVDKYGLLVNNDNRSGIIVKRLGRRPEKPAPK